MTDYPQIEWRSAPTPPRRRRHALTWLRARGTLALVLMGIALLIGLLAGVLGAGPVTQLNAANDRAERAQVSFAAAQDRQNDLASRAATETDPALRADLLDRARASSSVSAESVAEMQRAVDSARAAYFGVQGVVAALLVALLLIVTALIIGSLHARRSRV